MSIALSIGNNLTTGGVFTASAVNNTSVTNVTDFASLPGGGVLKLLSTQTASGSASISFTSGIDSTYDSYVFKFINIHPGTDEVNFTFQVDTGTNTNYNQTITSTTFRAYNYEDYADEDLGYVAEDDQAQGTSFQTLSIMGGTGIGADNDQNFNGSLTIFNPSNTTFVKHFLSRSSCNFSGDDNGTDAALDMICAGYVNTTTALTRVQFKMSSGNIDDGIIKMYGVV